MREIFNEKDGFQFYSILFNEFNSVKNTRQNAIDLLNLLEYNGIVERDKMISEAAKMLGILKKFSFSNKVLDEQHLRDLDDEIAVAQCVQQVFNKDCEKIREFFEYFNIQSFTLNILKFVQTDVFSQNNPMNNLGETFTNLLNTSFDSEQPQPPTYCKFGVFNKNGGVVEVNIEPAIPEDNRYEEGTSIKIEVINTDSNYNTIKYLGVYDGEDPETANCILDLAAVYADNRAYGEFNITMGSYLCIALEME